MFNPFKKKSKPAREVSAGARVRTPGPAPAVSRSERPSGGSPDAARNRRRIIGVLLAPHLTEKSSAGGSRGWYTFRVTPKANKIMIRNAVEDRYGVTVETVRTAAARAKKIRLGRIEGRTPGFKKAMVKVKEGQSIEFT